MPKLTIAIDGNPVENISTLRLTLRNESDQDFEDLPIVVTFAATNNRKPVLIHENIETAHELYDNEAPTTDADSNLHLKYKLKVANRSNEPIFVDNYTFTGEQAPLMTIQLIKKGVVLGSPKTFARKRSGWHPHPTEVGALVQAWTGLWHTVLPGRLLRVVVIRRPMLLGARKPGARKPPPAVEALFTTELTLSVEAILAQYRERWAVEITLRDSQAFAGFGQDQCRKRERVVGANTLRLVLAAARTLWFVEQTSRAVPLDLQRSRPWYRQKCAPSQLDIVWACREALQEAGVFPTPRFTSALATNQEKPEIVLSLAA